MHKPRTIPTLTALLIGLVGTSLAVADTRANTASEPRDVQPGAAAASVHRQTPKTDFGSVLGSGATNDRNALLVQTRELQQQVDSDAARRADAANAFSSSLTTAQRRELQSTCSTLIDDDSDVRAQRRLQALIEKHSDHNPDAVLRFCLDPAYRQLQRSLQNSVQSLERSRPVPEDKLNTAGEDSQLANVDLQNALQQQNQRFATIRALIKARHDTAKNAISNVR